MSAYTEYRDIRYREINGIKLFLDLYVPENRIDEKVPCCVFFHGGGWCEGDKGDVSGFPIVTDKILDKGYAVASVQYRLVGKNGGKYPDSVEDCLYALQFLDTQQICPINRFRKAVFGISAGGYMALMVALAQKHFNIYSPVAAVADMCGIVWFGGDDEEYNRLANPPATVKFIEDFLAGRSPKFSAPAEFLESSPQRPKIYVFHGNNDECVNTEFSRIFYRRASELGYNIKYLEVQNSNHTFLPVGGRLIPGAQDLYALMGNFMADNI